MTRNASVRSRPTLWAFLGAASACVLGALATELGPWYYGLIKPIWQPPDWLFGPVWTVMFTLIAIAGSFAWQRARDAAERRRVVVLLFVNLSLNVLWSLLFFRLHRPDLALIEVVFLWLSIAWPIVRFWPFARVASVLLLPYLAWVSFAATLNFSIVRLNIPIGL